MPTRVLVLGADDDDRYLRGMWAARALGYLLEGRTRPLGKIVAAVRAAARREPIGTATQIARVRRWQEEVEQQWHALTEREREVLALVAEGRSNKEIAQALQVTERTVEFHVSNVLGKLGLTSRLEAAVGVKEHGLCG